MLIPFIDSKLNKRCPRLGIQVFVFISYSANWIGILFVHSWNNVPKSETNFWQQCIITVQWNTVMTPNFAHKIVHCSAMYYPNLIIIHECSKKLLKMKNSKSFFLTPSTYMSDWDCGYPPFLCRYQKFFSVKRSYISIYYLLYATF